MPRNDDVEQPVVFCNPEFDSDTGHSALLATSTRLQQESLALLSDLVVAARDGPLAIDAIAQERLEASGCEIERFDYDPQSVPLVDEFAAPIEGGGGSEACLVAHLAGEGTGRSLLLFAHPDPEGYRSDPPWTSEPFHTELREGRIHGWGVADDLSGIVMLVQSLKVLQETGLRLAGDISLVSAPSKKHRRGISAALHRGLSTDGALYLHPAESGKGLNEIKAFAPGQIEFTVTLTGKPPDTSEPAHTAFAHRAINPFDKAQIITSVLRKLDKERGQRVKHPLLEAAIGRSTNLVITRCDFQDAGGLSRISPHCLLGGAVTLIPGEKLDAVKQEIEQAIAGASQADPWLRHNKPEVSWISGVSAAETSVESELYQLVASVLGNYGADPKVNPLHTSSDIRNPLVQKGIPTVGFGPLCGDLTMSGGSDEWVDADDLIKAIAATAEVMLKWCGTAETD